ncbi:MAG: FAD-dependent monooxygenase [Immundisolibacteraceae bacterium]|nr:FAD-dependent monooxygenase [Immundisolibacteraceae bacterium]
MKLDFDIIIAGGGIAGLTLAAALRDSGLTVALIDPGLDHPHQPDHIGNPALENPRVSAIYSGQMRLLQQLGICPEQLMNNLDSGQFGRGAAFKRMHIWDHSNRQSVSFDGNDVGIESLGWIIENRKLISAQYKLLSNSSTSLISDTITAIDYPEPQAIRAQLQSGSTLSCRLLIAADGSSSRLRRLAEIDIERLNYGQWAVTALVKPAQHHQFTAWQKFLADGPVALLPLADGYCSMVWSTNPGQAQQLVDLSESSFQQQLAETLDGRLGAIEQSSARARFPLFRQQALRYYSNRMALIGDAAHHIHPLAGMGANLGIVDALQLAEKIKQNADDPGRVKMLRSYDRQRRTEVDRYVSAQDSLRWCYGWSLPTAQKLRGLGVGLLDKSMILKPELLLQTLGLNQPFYPETIND